MVQRMKFGRRAGKVYLQPSDTLVRATLAAACLIGLLVVTLQAASAQQASSQAREACGADFKRLCSGVSPGGGRIRQCLSEHFAELSGPCKQVIGAPSGK